MLLRGALVIYYIALNFFDCYTFLNCCLHIIKFATVIRDRSGFMTIKRIDLKEQKTAKRIFAKSAAIFLTTGTMFICANTFSVNAEAYTYSMPVAGVSVALNEYLEEQQRNVISAGIESRNIPTVEAVATNAQAIAYINENYTNLGIANVNTSLNVRISPVNGKIIGRIPAGGACEVLEESDGWFKIRSGQVEGYVSGNYLLTGSLAVERAVKELSAIATVNVSGLNMRKGASTSAGIIRVLRKNTVVNVLEDLGEWIKISHNNNIGYVYAKYTKQEYKLREALTLDEIKYGKEISDIREQVVAYAKQFVGNPYVYGGNSLTKGTDCSGFVKLIMAHFGITTPRTATTQYNAGKKISVAELLPGDLIVYGDKQIEHIAIYIGDGQVIHASNVKTGIKYSKYNYRKIWGCVRFIED